MRPTTKQDPTCYHGAIEYLAELENTNKFKTLIFKTIKDLRHKDRYGNYFAMMECSCG